MATYTAKLKEILRATDAPSSAPEAAITKFGLVRSPAGASLSITP